MERILAILTEDAVYGHTLAEYMSSSHILSYRIVPFYDSEEYELFREEREVNVLLVGEELVGHIRQDREEHFLILSEQRKDKVDSVFKYQSLDVIVKEINYKLHNKYTFSLDNNYSVKTAVVAGFKGGSGVSSLALCLASALSRENSVLFISFDPFLVLPEGLETGKGDMSELIYTLRLYGPLWTEYAEGFIRHNKDFDYISGVLCFEDLFYFGREEARNFYAGLSNSGRYQKVVIDIGMPVAGSYVLYEKSDELYLIGEEGTKEEEVFVKQLVKLFDDEILASRVSVHLPYDEKIQKGGLSYSEYEETSMYTYAKSLISKKNVTIVTESMEKENERQMPVVYEDKKKKNPKGKLRRLMEKGFSEGFNG